MKLKTRFLIVFLVVIAGFAGVSGLSGYLFFRVSQLKKAEALCSQSIQAHDAFRRLTAQLLYTDTLDDAFAEWKNHYDILESRLHLLESSESLKRLLVTRAQQSDMAAMMAFWDATRKRLDRVEKQVHMLLEKENPSRDGLVYQYFDLREHDVLAGKKSVNDASLYLAHELETRLLSLVAMVNEEIEGQMHDTINRIILVNLVIAVVVISILAVFLSSLMSHLTTWLGAMKIIGNGGFPPKIAASGDDELSQISNAINLTADNLRRIHGELETHIRELCAAKEAAESADRAKSRFLANMSHELKTPLTAIIGFSQILQQSGSLDTEQKKQLASINRNGKHLLGLINDVLTMAKIDAGRETVNEENVELDQFLKELEEMFSPRAAAKGLSFSCSVAPQVPSAIIADRTKLRQVMINMIQNALKFTDAGKISIFVTTEAYAEMPGGNRPAVRFIIKDMGCGIEKNQLSDIFESFVQVRGAQEGHRYGTGLGLAICRQTIIMMGGVIGVESDPAAGSTFWFKLPLSGSAPITSGMTGPVSLFGCPPAIPERETDSPGRPHFAAGVAPSQSRGDAGVTMLDRLSNVPRDILERLEQAALRAELDRMNDLIDAVRVHDPRLATLFTNLIDDFAYDKVIDLLRIKFR